MNQPEHTPTTPELLSALADGELDLRESTDALEQIADDPRGAQRIAFQQQLRRSVASAMDEPSMRFPEALRSEIERIAHGTPSETPAATSATSAAVVATAPSTPLAPAQSPVLARIGRWAPAAVAAVLLFAAVGVFVAGRSGGPQGPATPVLDVNSIHAFGQRHMACTGDPSQQLHSHERFGQTLQELPGNLSDYFHHNIDAATLDLSNVEYDYQLAGVCSTPGSGAVHIVYRHHDNPDRAISLWIVPSQERITQQMQPGRLYIETAEDMDHPVILWEDGGLLFYLIGDSLEDAQHAVQALRNAPA